MIDTELKRRESLLRRAARRQGLRLEKSRRRDPRALDYGTYQLVNQLSGLVALANWDTYRPYGLTLDDVEHYLRRQSVLDDGVVR